MSSEENEESGVRYQVSGVDNNKLATSNQQHKTQTSMTEKVTPVLGDKSVFPSEEILQSITGEMMIIWKRIVDHAESNYKDITKEWRYYNDGKQWLFKLQYKLKTVFWSSVQDNTFRITFYFGNKAEHLLIESDLPDAIKEQFVSAKTFGTMRPVTFTLSEDTDIESIFKLIYLKTSIK